MPALLDLLLRRIQREPDPATLAAKAPRLLWVELTSRCPLDCVFCSRRTLRGDGEDLDFDLFARLLRSADRPEVVVLNHSGESTHHARIGEAVALARSTGAMTELSSALAVASPTAVRALVENGLDVLMVSVHALSPERWRRMYGRSSPSALRRNLDLLLEARSQLGSAKPGLTFTFVATMENLEELPAVGELARQVGASGVFIIPVLRRDEVPERFEQELEGGRPTPAFVAAVGAAVDESRRRVPEVPFTVLDCGSIVSEETRRLGPRPRPYPAPLPRGARIATCFQNPWETAHVLANGDVVVCEALERTPMGNLHQEPFEHIWAGPAYADFRRRYAAGDVETCRACPWKLAHRPSRLRHRVRPQDGHCRELLWGWHAPEPGHRWSWRRSLALVAAPRGARRLVVEGMLPEGRAGRGSLRVSIHGRLLGEIHGEALFRRSFELGSSPPSVLPVEFVATAPVCPARDGLGADVRELGFGLLSLEVRR